MLSATKYLTAVLLDALLCLALVGCDGNLLGTACTSELRANLIVEVRDSVTGAPSAWGATGTALHEDGRVTELSAFDTLRLGGSWAREQAGDYLVSVRKPGYTPVEIAASVNADACHVKTGHVPVTIALNSGYSFESAVVLSLGEHVQGWNASAGIHTRADTLVISGRAFAPCSQLSAVASRSGRELHVQLEPQHWPDMPCNDQKPLQQFLVAYQLPLGATDLFVTNAMGEPTVLFAGTVWLE
jgi:hypothetical protein